MADRRRDFTNGSSFERTPQPHHVRLHDPHMWPIQAPQTSQDLLPGNSRTLHKVAYAVPATQLLPAFHFGEDVHAYHSRISDDGTYPWAKDPQTRLPAIGDYIMDEENDLSYGAVPFTGYFDYSTQSPSSELGQDVHDSQFNPSNQQLANTIDPAEAFMDNNIGVAGVTGYHVGVEMGEHNSGWQTNYFEPLSEDLPTSSPNELSDGLEPDSEKTVEHEPEGKGEEEKEVEDLSMPAADEDASKVSDTLLLEKSLSIPDPVEQACAKSYPPWPLRGRRTPKLPFMQLPLEIILEIAEKHLDWRSMAKLVRVNKFLHAFLNQYFYKRVACIDSLFPTNPNAKSENCPTVFQMAFKRTANAAYLFGFQTMVLHLKALGRPVSAEQMTRAIDEVFSTPIWKSRKRKPNPWTRYDPVRRLEEQWKLLGFAATEGADVNLVAKKLARAGWEGVDSETTESVRNQLTAAGLVKTMDTLKLWQEHQSLENQRKQLLQLIGDFNSKLMEKIDEINIQGIDGPDFKGMAVTIDT